MDNLYKYSQFNIVVTETEDEVTLFNSVTEQSITILKADYNVIIADKNIDEGDYELSLFDGGFLVPTDKDEYAQVEKSVTAKINSGGNLNIVIAPSMACNYRCEYCFEEERTHTHEVMSQETIDQTVKFIVESYQNCKNRGKINIKWFGGEPLLQIKTIEYISKQLDVHKIPVYGWMFSNGRLLTKENVSILEKCHIKGPIVIAIDGLARTNAKLKGCTEDSLDIVLSNIAYAQDKLPIRINLNVSKYSKDEMKELLNKIIVDYNITKTSIKVERIYGREYSLTPYELYEIDKELQEYSQDLGLKGYFLSSAGLSTCEAWYKNHFVIAWDGTLYRCEDCIGMKEYACGSIFTGIEDTEGSKFFTELNIPDKCHDCSYLPICLGGCKYNRIVNIDKFNCEGFKEVVLHQLKESKYRRRTNINYSQRYKYSFYNIEVETKNSNTITIYNTASGRYVTIPDNIYALIKDNDNIRPIDIPIQLIGTGILVHSELDELNHFTNISEQKKNNISQLMLTVALTKACNYHCSYCFEKAELGVGNISDEVIEALVKYVKSYIEERPHIKSIKTVWFGGEPMLNIPAIKKIYKLLSDEVGLPIIGHITTNGRYLTKENLEKLSECNIQSAQITLDGLKEEYVRLKGCKPEDFDAVIKNIKDIQNSIKLEIRLNVGDNKESIKQLIKYMADENLHVKAYMSNIKNHDKPSEEFLKDHYVYVDSLKEIWDFVKENDIAEYVMGIAPICKTVGCQANCDTNLAIDPYGKIYRCHEFMFMDGYKVGTVFDGITNQSLNDTFVKNQLYDKCHTCKFRPLCQGDCTTDRIVSGKGINCESLINEFIFKITEAVI